MPVTRERIIGPRLRRGDYALDAQALAPALIGRLMVRRLDDGALLAGRIVETEAYLGTRDRAAHTFGGRRTPRNESMYAAPGTAYVYFTYGMHFCFNVVCGAVDEPVAVLLRALEPVAGIDKMTHLRSTASKARVTRFAVHDLCRGPARLCQALAITRALNGLDMTGDPHLWIAEPGPDLSPLSPGRVVRAARVGIDSSGSWARRRLRWLVAAHPCISVPPRSGPAKRTLESG